MVDIQHRGTVSSLTRSQVIIPEYDISCNGRITGYLVSLEQDRMLIGSYPRIQVWRPTSSTVYSRVGTVCELTESDISRMTDSAGNEYHLGNVSCNVNDQIEFQSGDVIGYHQELLLRYRLWNNETVGYTSYRLQRLTNTLNTIDTSSVDDTFSNTQPLIQLIYGKGNDTILIFFLNYILKDLAVSWFCVYMRHV